MCNYFTDDFSSFNDPEDFIYIQRIIDTILKNNRKYECKEFNTYIELYKSLNKLIPTIPASISTAKRMFATFTGVSSLLTT